MAGLATCDAAPFNDENHSDRGASMSSRTSAALLSTIAIAAACGGHPSTSPSPANGAPITRAMVPRLIDSMVNAPEFRTAMWGVLIVDPVKHDTLYRHN